MTEKPPETPDENPPQDPPTPPAPPVDDPPVDSAPAEEEPAAPEHIAVDGILGPETIKRLKETMKNSPDKTGKLSSNSLKYLQAYLQERVDHRLELTGKMEKQGSLTFDPTIAALQRYLKTPVNGKITEERSNTIVALQRRLNEGWF